MLIVFLNTKVLCDNRLICYKIAHNYKGVYIVCKQYKHQNKGRNFMCKGCDHSTNVPILSIILNDNCHDLILIFKTLKVFFSWHFGDFTIISKDFFSAIFFSLLLFLKKLYYIIYLFICQVFIVRFIFILLILSFILLIVR